MTPLQDVASALDIPITEFGNPHYDDPSLALLFSQLKSKTLQAAKGTSEISGRTEFNLYYRWHALSHEWAAMLSHWILSGLGRLIGRLS